MKMVFRKHATDKERGFTPLLLEGGSAGRRRGCARRDDVAMANGIRDKVVILGMGCSKFGERWDKEADNLMVEASPEAIADAGIDAKRSRRPGSPPPSRSSTSASRRRRWPWRCVCRTFRSRAWRTTAPAAPRRSAARSMRSPPARADIALALGVEKLKDTGYGGLPQRGRGPPQRHDQPERVGAGQLRPARRRLSRQAQRRSPRT